MAESRLFKPLKIGNVEVKHRISMAPVTRLRSSVDHVPQPLMKEYYGQRASVPGTLLISEGTFASDAGGFPGAPGIWRDDQVAAWRTITDEVHRQGSFIFSQIAAAATWNGADVTGSNAVPADEEDGHPTVPRAMTTEDIKQAISEFATAAKNAIDAGFDGVEIHAANGYLLDRFTQDVSNQRTDEYGGSVENRSRFVHEIMKAVVEAVGPTRVGLRLSPWSTFQGMKMADPIPQFTDLIYKAKHLDLAYLHLVESRIAGADDAESAGEGLDFAYEIWDRPILVAGGYQAANAQKLVDEEHPDKDIVVGFGRYFISNPDLVYRIREGLELNAYDRSTFYTNLARGYVDYQFSPEYLASAKVQAAVA
ncbi:NADH:flavin oxidoreductase/NADH oxidase family protein-like protein [Apiospora arundinis]|uniref:NADH:flavin oxidoreductase/NADH oxidase family protein-like protein n=1 Tax=Apiospora arundinis TaxID=335852 RepID=A0ABR2I595_9PEZI